VCDLDIHGLNEHRFAADGASQLGDRRSIDFADPSPHAIHQRDGSCSWAV
jgi:hypothetical protein